MTARLSRFPRSAGERARRPSAVPAQLVRDAVRGPAQPLPPSLQAEMQGRLGADFSAVRLHTGSAARASAAALGARAYTTGDHVVIGGGTDKHVLAHELTHVIQQRQGPVAATSQGSGLRVSDPSDAFEKAAEANAARVMRAPVPSRGDRTTAPAATAPAAIAQRLVGFEAEFAVPTMPPLPGAVTLANGPTGHPATPAVEGFLAGGRPYGIDLGHNAHFTLKPDHDNLQATQRAIRERLAAMHYVLPPMAHTMSNLEYVTPALDELAPNSTTAFQAQFQAIANHAASLFPHVRAAASPIPAPAADSRTGIPLADLRAWLDTDYPHVQAEVDAYIAEIRNSFYLQATAGIIPSALADLHKSRVPWLLATNTYEAAASAVHDTVSTLVALPAFADHPFIAALRIHNTIDYEALVGLLYLTFSYMVGSALNQTNLFSGSTPKNSVPFMSKLTNLTDAINLAAPTLLRATKVPLDVRLMVRDHFNASPYITVAYWINAEALALDVTRGPTLNPATFVNEVLRGAGPALTTAATYPARTYLNPDPVPAAVSAASGDQRGVQVEYRHILARPGTADLSHELMKIVREVRNLNTRHLGFWPRRALLNAADQ